MNNPGMVIGGALVEIGGIVLVVGASWRIALGLFCIWLANVILQASKR